MLVHRFIKTIGTTVEDMEKFADRFRKLDSTENDNPTTQQAKSKRRIFKKPAAYVSAVEVFAEGEILGSGDVILRLPDLSERTVQNYLKDAVQDGALTRPRRGQYQRPLKVQKP